MRYIQIHISNIIHKYNPRTETNLVTGHIHLPLLRRRLRLPLLLESKDTGTVRQKNVFGVLAGVTSLVEQLQVAGIDSERLISVHTNKLSVTDVVGPGSTAVRLASEWVALCSSIRRPRPAKAAGRERTEVPTLRPNGLDYHQVLVLALYLVHLDSLEQVVGRVGQDDGRRTTEAAREVANRHAGSVNLAVVSSEEQVHVRAVSDQRLVNGTSARAGDGACEQGLGRGPPIGIGGVGRGAVREGSRTPLVSENPHALGCKVEEGGCNSALAHAGLGS